MLKHHDIVGGIIAGNPTNLQVFNMVRSITAHLQNKNIPCDLFQAIE